MGGRRYRTLPELQSLTLLRSSWDIAADERCRGSGSTRMRTKTTKAQLALTRRSCGPLNTVQDKQEPGTTCLCNVLFIGHFRQLAGPRSEMDSAVSQFILAAWREGEARALVANLISWISDTEPSLCIYFNEARRLHMSWTKANLADATVRSHGEWCALWLACCFSGLTWKTAP